MHKERKSCIIALNVVMNLRKSIMVDDATTRAWRGYVAMNSSMMATIARTDHERLYWSQPEYLSDNQDAMILRHMLGQFTVPTMEERHELR
jgi:hypothetical protein